MEKKELVNLLLSKGILNSENDLLSISEEYLSVRDSKIKLLRERIFTFDYIFQAERQRDQLQKLLKINEALVMTFSTISTFCPNLEFKNILRLALVIRQLEQGITANSGAPSNFLSVHAQDLPAAVQLSQKGIVYIWRDDCPPCDVTRANIEEVVNNQPSDFVLLATYGPKHPKVLNQELDVTGAPTILFIKHGDINSRLIGPQKSITIKKEIETVRDLVNKHSM